MEICLCRPTLYTIDEEGGEAYPIMIPVSSTAIPIHELPVFKVSPLLIRFTQLLNPNIIPLYTFNEGICFLNCAMGYVILFWFKVGYGFGKAKKKKQKPSNLKDIQLITAKNQHNFILSKQISPAGVQELTKEEFDQFNLQKK